MQAAGRTARRPTGSPSTPSGWRVSSGRASRYGHAERAVVLGVPGLRLGRARAGSHDGAAALARCTTSTRARVGRPAIREVLGDEAKLSITSTCT